MNVNSMYHFYWKINFHTVCIIRYNKHRVENVEFREEEEEERENLHNNNRIQVHILFIAHSVNFIFKS